MGSSPTIQLWKSVLVDKGIAEDKIISLGIFDYLIPNFQEKSGQTKDQPMIVAGNLAQEKLVISMLFLQNLPIISMVLVLMRVEL